MSTILFNIVTPDSDSTILFSIAAPDSGSTILFSIVDNYMIIFRRVKVNRTVYLDLRHCDSYYHIHLNYQMFFISQDYRFNDETEDAFKGR